MCLGLKKYCSSVEAKKAGFVIHCSAAFPITRPHFPDSQENFWISDDNKFQNSLGNRENFWICVTTSFKILLEIWSICEFVWQNHIWYLWLACHLLLPTQKFSWKFSRFPKEFVPTIITWKYSTITFWNYPFTQE